MLNGITLERAVFQERRVSDVAYQELAGLWEAVFGERPAVIAEPGLTAAILVRCLPPAEPYGFGGADEADGV
jgi:hypothetical protein